ncbi:hypothetical protein HBH56_153570 [Parastagonospora nodorum]|uniref:Uncharacterized protein n=1 Tax=Phaeosphaeria nodorum (strain SN15 / ATCC MYA-4574 / FGSC 10173) TaxID=321614 RepID=A0A7U2HZ47_PHANO|nr:hypothetical protein HBH56_153570 [Parastagonospora nodorum]QRC95998.1 hypothetical protein JI435_303950 [Parastagonospora nodorum SN15]KAH3926753.1 hypothetical protein HBH54_164110 [Parastagonospora nodorum]KAH3943218.1 hypothetical protein HBH53_175110 [Parastagonospora nodorum]KAH4116618.1 hypothetical protein HBH47_164440 [Parastagonospora nodorum]
MLRSFSLTLRVLLQSPRLLPIGSKQTPFVTSLLNAMIERSRPLQGGLGAGSCSFVETSGSLRCLTEAISFSLTPQLNPS